MKVDRFIEDIYSTLSGELAENACVPGVENLYEEGKPCMKWYSEMLDAYGRICDRLDVQDEDEDVEIIINSFLSICQEVGYYMYYYGAEFGREKAEPADGG